MVATSPSKSFKPYSGDWDLIGEYVAGELIYVPCRSTNTSVLPLEVLVWQSWVHGLKLTTTTIVKHEVLITLFSLGVAYVMGGPLHYTSICKWIDL
jgi:hypothetical protein